MSAGPAILERTVDGFVDEILPPESVAPLKSRDIRIGDKRTSVRLEPIVWDALKAIADREDMTIHELCTHIAQRRRGDSSLTSTIRAFIVGYCRALTTDRFR